MVRPAFSLGTKGGGGLVQSLIVSLAGTIVVEFVDAVTFKLRMPQRGKIVGVTMSVDTLVATHSTSTLDVLVDAVSLLASVIDVSALVDGTPLDVEGAGLSAAADDVAKDAEIRLVTVESGGTTPGLLGCLVQIDYVALGD